MHFIYIASFILANLLSLSYAQLGILWPYGEGVDSRLSKTGSSPRNARLDLNKGAVTIFNQQRSFINIYEHGVINFDSDPMPLCPDLKIRTPYLSAFWLQTDIARGGNVYYRQEGKTSESSLNRQAIVDEINRATKYEQPPENEQIVVGQIESIVVITWEKVAAPYSIFVNPLHRNTFQMVIVSTPGKSHVVTVFRRIDYFVFASYSSTCKQGAVFGLSNAPANYMHEMTGYFHLAAHNIIHYSNIQPYNVLGRYVTLPQNNFNQPAPPKIECGLNPRDMFCITGVPAMFCVNRPVAAYKHPSRCTSYVVCTGFSNPPSVFTCGATTNFNPFFQSCDWQGYYRCTDVNTSLKAPTDESVKTGEKQFANSETVALHTNICVGEQSGIYADPLSCDHFILCSNTRTYRRECPTYDGVHLYYNTKTQGCDWQKNVDCRNGVRTATATVTQQQISFRR